MAKRLRDTVRSLATSLGVTLSGWERGDSPLIYICHVEHEHDRTYTENLTDYLSNRGAEYRIVEFGDDGLRPTLEACLEDATAIIGFNSQLDHSWLPSGSFIEAAAERGIPVIQWILDHPSQRWEEFINSTRRNSRFLFNSSYSERYFQRYCLPGSPTAWVGGVGPSRRSRIEGLSEQAFRTRPFNCMIALGLKQTGRSVADTEADIEALSRPLQRAVKDATASARNDLIAPVETHLDDALRSFGEHVPNSIFNHCFRLVEESVQIFRRRKIFSVARNYPVLIQSDETAGALISGGTAKFVPNVSMPATLANMRLCRSVLSVSYANDMIHDRTSNGCNAGCVNIVEDNLVHQSVFEHGRNALLFRYDDDSLAECLDIVCNDPDRAYRLAEAGMTLRDFQPLRFGGFDNIFALARQVVVHPAEVTA